MKQQTKSVPAGIAPKAPKIDVSKYSMGSVKRSKLTSFPVPSFKRWLRSLPCPWRW
jgi:hypothetical protein